MAMTPAERAEYCKKHAIEGRNKRIKEGFVALYFLTPPKPVMRFYKLNKKRKEKLVDTFCFLISEYFKKNS